MINAEEQIMRVAINEALKARASGDYAIGAVIVLGGGEVITKAYNCSKIRQDPTQHAELTAIQQASKILQSRYLDGCVLYTTHEPCPMCASAMVWAKLSGLVYGARMEDMAEYRMRSGNDSLKWRTIRISAKDVFAKQDLQIEVVPDFMREQCLNLFHSQ